MPLFPRTGEGFAGDSMDSIFGERWDLPDGIEITGFLRDDVQIVSEDGLRLGAATLLEVRTTERRTLANGQNVTRVEDGVVYRVADMADDSDGWTVCTLARGY